MRLSHCVTELLRGNAEEQSLVVLAKSNQRDADLRLARIDDDLLIGNGINGADGHALDVTQRSAGLDVADARGDSLCRWLRSHRVGVLGLRVRRTDQSVVLCIVLTVRIRDLARIAAPRRADRPLRILSTGRTGHRERDGEGPCKDAESIHVRSCNHS